MAPDVPPTDARLALILRRLGAGGTITAAGMDVGVTRKTIQRWRSPGQWCVPGFGAACDRVIALAPARTPEAFEEIEQIVDAWAAPAPLVYRGGDDVLDQLGDHEQAEDDGAGDLAPLAEPDVLDVDGRELASRGRAARAPAPRIAPPAHLTAEQLYPKRRAPTREEWISMMADLALDPLAPASVRCAAIASGNAALVGQQPRRAAPELTPESVAAEARERGRDPGVPRSVWEEAKRSFLGPALVPDADDSAGGDVVELEQSTPSRDR